MDEASEAVLSWTSSAHLRPDKRILGHLWWMYARLETGRRTTDPPPEGLTEEQKRRVDAAVILHFIESTVGKSGSKREEAHFQSAAARFLRDRPEQMQRFATLTRKGTPAVRKAARSIINLVRRAEPT